MIKIISALLIATLLFTNSALAEWVKFGSNEGNTFFMDPTTVRKEGQLIQIWVLQEHDKPQTDGEMSSRYLKEIDCKKLQDRVLSGMSFTGRGATGNVIHSTDLPNNWSAIPPMTISEMHMKKVCAKK